HAHETLLPFQLEAQLGIRKPGVIIDEKFENVSEVHHISREAEFDLKVPEDVNTSSSFLEEKEPYT
ncbi:MAG: hypothetical protein N0A00_03490, partial [Candidatus Bathyarchaeota archaeon]|nr:hypothetical protein [Candidatus Bathyarchaeota archaeon]